jgi:hypothetical protein
MRSGRICGVEYLHGKSDDELIAEARQLFQTKGLAEGVEGFEVWDHTRFIYRFVLEGTPERRSPADGLRGPPSWLQRMKGKLSDKFSAPESDQAWMPA